MIVQDWLNSKQGHTFRYKLEKVQYALDLLGNPEKKHPIIHIAGTNGKGSTVAFLTELFRKQGFRVGSFVSPHIVSLHDRIRINGLPIGDARLEELLLQVHQLEENVKDRYEILSYFEVMMLVMFLYFSREPLDVVLLEVGIGGLLDTTNVVQPEISVITSIGLDHQDILGESLPEIAFQKAGIIKHNCPIVTGPLDQTCLHVVQAVADQKQAPLLYYGRDFSFNNQTFSSNNEVFSNITLSLKGRYQEENAAVSIQTFLLFMKRRHLAIDSDKIKAALSTTRWAGRLEKITASPTIYLDGAHNVPAIERLIEFIQTQSSNQITILFAALERKDVEAMLLALQTKLPTASLFVTHFSYKEATTSFDASLTYVDDYREFIRQWQERAQLTDTLFVTGSLYFISEVRRYFLKENDQT